MATYRITFVSDPEDSNVGLLVFDSPSYADGDPVVSVEALVVQTPAGAPLAPVTFDSNSSATVAIPLDAAGNYQYGSYRVRFTDPDQVYEGQAEFVRRDGPIYPFDIQELRFLAQVRLRDAGNYVTNATTRRVWTIARSAIPVFNASARNDEYTTYDQSEQVIAIGYTGVMYSFSFYGDTSWEAAAGVTFKHIFRSRTITENIDWRKTTCDLVRCAADYVQRVRDQRAACGENLTTADLDNISFVNTSLFRFLGYVQCGDHTQAQERYTALENLIGACDCGCDENTPRKLTGSVAYTLPDGFLGGNSGSALITTDGTGALNITILSGETRITVSNVLGLLHANAISRGASDVDVSLTPEAFTILDGTDLAATWRDATNSGVAYRLVRTTGDTVQIRAAIFTDVPPSPGTYDVLTSLLPSGYRPTSSTIYAPVVSEDKFMGTARVLPTGQIRFDLSYEFSPGAPVGEYGFFFTLEYAADEVEVFDYENVTIAP